jgi:acyl carrier protein
MTDGTQQSVSLGAILDQVRHVVAERVGNAPTNEFSIGAKFSDDLHLDDLDYVEIIMAAETRFGIEISDDVAEKLETVGDLAEYIVFRLNPSTPIPSALTRKRRLSAPLEGVAGCAQASVKTIGWTTALALVTCAFSSVGIALLKQPAAPLIVAISATMIVTVAPVIYDLYVRKGKPRAMMATKAALEQTRQRRNGLAAAILLAVGVAVSLLVPCPTITQQRVLQIVVSLAAGAFAANLSGFLHVKVGKVIRAGGALAAFVLVLLWNPASWSIQGGPNANAGCQGVPARFSQSK